MSVSTKTLKVSEFTIIHPLDDKPEQKRNPDGLGHMEMTRSVRLSLISLRVYLLAIVGLALYHFGSLFAAGLHHVGH